MRIKTYLALFLVSTWVWVAPVPAADPPPVGKKVTWTTPDGVRLEGRYQPRSGPGHLVWVLLHGLGSDQNEWLDFACQLAKQGDGFLIYDARGHGASKQTESGGKLDYREFRTLGPGSEWDRMIGDLASAVDFIHHKFTLNAHGIAVGGASLGANVALAYASQHPEVHALILLSPGLQYAGIGSQEPFRNFGTRPVFIAASPGDSYAYASVQQLRSMRSDDDIRYVEGPGAAHGVNMFGPAFTPKLLDWLKKVR
jgi:pimeloyl-ACP methyl ester carboxylesterase